MSPDRTGAEPAEVVVDLGRDEARQLAERELADPTYDAEPPLFQQVLEWVLAQVSDLLGRAAGAVGGAGWLILVILLAALVVTVLVRFGRAGKPAGRRDSPVFAGARRTAEQHRQAADDAAAAGEWARAVVERFRLVVATLEERGVLEPRPGRTADEVASEAGAVLPDLTERLLSAAAVFDDVHYGRRPAGAAHDDALQELYTAVTKARPGRSGPLRAGGTDLVAPR